MAKISGLVLEKDIPRGGAIATQVSRGFSGRASWRALNKGPSETVIMAASPGEDKATPWEKGRRRLRLSWGGVGQSGCDPMETDC